MQTIEIIISSLFLLIFFSLISSNVSIEKSTDISLQKQHIYSDIWRTLELRGDLEKLDDLHRQDVESDLDNIGSITGYCIFIEGERFTNCRGAAVGQLLLTDERIVISDAKPRKVIYSVYQKSSPIS